MVNNNKILTVSYGTFSCTLEGFDDSFEMMKEIAEYFRGLAADDRYFGAEPPRLDAEMLTEIARRDKTRRVEAQSDESGTGITLRASPETKSAEHPPLLQEPSLPQSAPTAAESSSPMSLEVELTEAAAKPATGPDSIAAKLQRIRAVVSRHEAAAHAPVESIGAAETASPAADRDTTLSDEDDLYAAPASAADAELAAVFDRIDSQDGADNTDETTPSDTADQHLTAYDEDYDEADASDSGQILAALAGQKARETREDASETTAHPEEDAHAEMDLDLSSYFPPGDAPEEDASEEDAVIAENTPGDAAKEDDSPTVNSAEDEAAISRENARLVQLKRAEIAAALAADDDDTPRDTASGALSTEDEADLMRELAALQDDLIGDQSAEDTATAPENDFVQPAEDTPDTARDEKAAPDNDVSRLMAAAEEKMDAPESSTSRNTYSRLRAAVAAAQAERTAGRDLSAGNTDDAYRKDLASVVRPRRAVAGRSERPAGDTRSPLKLVAEQRIDIAPAKDKPLPVKPRRITSTDLAETNAAPDDQAAAFAAYVERMGANDLPQLLEAAAAYLSFVEEREEFSRPQLMNKVRQLPEVEFNREDGLRSFGLLLREGKIQKNGAGRFTASSEIGFRPAKRAVG